MKAARAVIECADNLDFMAGLEDGAFKLVVTSPPYNLGKSYERARLSLGAWVESQRRVVAECVRLLHGEGSICWQVGNSVVNGEIFPLDSPPLPGLRRAGVEAAQPHRLAFRPRAALLEAPVRAV